MIYVSPVLMLFLKKLKEYKETPTNKLKEEILRIFFQKPKKIPNSKKDYETVFDIRPVADYWRLPVSLHNEIELEGYHVEIEHDTRKYKVTGEELVYIVEENKPAYFYLYYKRNEIFRYTHIIVQKEHIYDSPYSKFLNLIHQPSYKLLTIHIQAIKQKQTMLLG